MAFDVKLWRTYKQMMMTKLNWDRVSLGTHTESHRIQAVKYSYHSSRLSADSCYRGRLSASLIRTRSGLARLDPGRSWLLCVVCSELRLLWFFFELLLLLLLPSRPSSSTLADVVLCSHLSLVSSLSALKGSGVHTGNGDFVVSFCWVFFTGFVTRCSGSLDLFE